MVAHSSYFAKSMNNSSILQHPTEWSLKAKRESYRPSLKSTLSNTVFEWRGMIISGDSEALQSKPKSTLPHSRGRIPWAPPSKPWLASRPDSNGWGQRATPAEPSSFVKFGYPLLWLNWFWGSEDFVLGSWWLASLQVKWAKTCSSHFREMSHQSHCLTIIKMILLYQSVSSGHPVGLANVNSRSKP